MRYSSCNANRDAPALERQGVHATRALEQGA